MIQSFLKKIISIILLTLLSTSCTNSLKVIKTNSLNFIGEDGTEINIEYYHLSDQTLPFIKLYLPNNQVITLPKVRAASGEKYSDNVKYIWWTKGHEGFIQERNSIGEWHIKYSYFMKID